MPMISFRKPRPPADAPEGMSLMDALLAAGLPVASSCRGDGVCAKCRVVVVEGKENLSRENETEAYLRERHNIPKVERVSCQVQVLGPVTVDTSYW